MDVVVISFDGGIQDFPVLIQSVDGLLSEGTRHLAIDLHTLPFINSAALGWLIKAQRGMEQQGGELALARLQPAIQQILEMTNLDVVFPSFETVEEAISYLGGDAEKPAGEATTEGERKPVRRHSWR
jgi:anti-sigma B factor antagonist